MRLRYHRIKNRLTQKELAKLVNVHPTTVHNHETGQREPSPEMVKRYKRALKVESLQ